MSEERLSTAPHFKYKSMGQPRPIPDQFRDTTYSMPAEGMGRRFASADSIQFN